MLIDCNDLSELEKLDPVIKEKLTKIGEKQRQLLAKYRLKGEEIVFRYSNLEIGAIWNGIGPDWFPGWLRDIVTWMRPCMSVASVIHDLQWWESDGTRASFFESNEMLYDNGCIIADELAWYNPERYLVKGRAWRFKKACDLGGWSAWLYSYERKCIREHKAPEEAK